MRETIERVVTEIDPPEEAEDGAVVVLKFIAVIDVLHPDGAHQMYSISADASGRPLVQWDREGLLHYALYNYVAADDPEED